MEKSEQEKYYELTYYTLSHPDKAFIHQHAVDAFAAQTVNETTKPIAITFALVGLYLQLEKNYTGRQVQLAHMQMAKNKKPCPKFALPKHRGEITVSDVLATPPGTERDVMIHKWCASVWEAYKESRQAVIDLAETELALDR
ncbi:MAG TPA: DUF5946 family protein [Bacteroidia bacterium]|jgi:hypothetical protein|nr:DUF5946 family protein [Bacteroidia bacterium]